VVVAYGNLKAWWDLAVLGTGAGGSLFGVASGLVITALLAVVACIARLRSSELGLEPARFRPAARLGTRVGLVVGFTAAGLLVLVGVGGNAELTPAARASWPELARRIFLFLAFDTALPEEVAFRSVLFAFLLRALGTPAPSAGSRPGHLGAELVEVVRAMRCPVVVFSALPFMLWHVVVVQQDGPQPWPVVAGKLAGIYLGGLFFGSLRLRGGHVVASGIAHWVFDAAAFSAARLASG
jgi:membrane protease YdiL (CAAX protease family)